MADPNFFTRSGAVSVEEIQAITGCSVENASAGNVVLEDVRPLHLATVQDLSFFDNIKYKDDFINTKAGACFVSPQMVEFAPNGMVCLVCNNPYKAYALTAQHLYPEHKPETEIAPTAYVYPSAKIGAGVSVGHNAYIGHNVEIGEGSWIEPNAMIMDGVKIGKNCRIGSHATVSHSIIGDYVRLYPGARVGQDGFGFAIDPAGHVKVPQLGRVIIEDHVEIGANTTIDRGAGPDTVIGQGTWIDNLVQIGHNVVIGRGCVIVAQVGISGSTKLGDYVVMGGQVGIAGHLNIGSGARIAAQSGIMNNIPAGAEYMGSPAFPKSQYFRQVAALNRLIKKKKND